MMFTWVLYIGVTTETTTGAGRVRDDDADVPLVLNAAGVHRNPQRKHTSRACVPLPESLCSVADCGDPIPRDAS